MNAPRPKGVWVVYGISWSFGVQVLVSTLAGQTFYVPIAHSSWELPQIAALPVIALSALSAVARPRHATSRGRSVSLGLLWALLIFITALLVGFVTGYANHNVALWGDLALFASFPAVYFAGRAAPPALHSGGHFRTLARLGAVIALLSIPQLFAARFGIGATWQLVALTPATWFLLLFSLIFYWISHLFVTSGRRYETIGALVAISTSLFTSFEKAFVVLIVVVLFVSWILLWKSNQGSTCNTIRPVRSIVAILVILVSSGLTIYTANRIWTITEPVSFVGSYQETIDRRFLREDTGDISGGRLRLWRSSIRSTIDSPLFGTGIGSLIATDSVVEDRRLLSPHSIVAQLLLSIGIPGAFMALFLLLGVYIRNYRYLVGGIRSRYYYTAFLFAVTVLVYALYGTIARSPSTYILAALFLGQVSRTRLG